MKLCTHASCSTFQSLTAPESQDARTFESSGKKPNIQQSVGGLFKHLLRLLGQLRGIGWPCSNQLISVAASCGCQAASFHPSKRTTDNARSIPAQTSLSSASVAHAHQTWGQAGSASQKEPQGENLKTLTLCPSMTFVSGHAGVNLMPAARSSLFAPQMPFQVLLS